MEIQSCGYFFFFLLRTYNIDVIELSWELLNKLIYAKHLKQCLAVVSIQYMLAFFPTKYEWTFFFKHFLFYIGLESINNIVIVSSVQQSNSAIHIHVSWMNIFKNWNMTTLYISAL